MENPQTSRIWLAPQVLRRVGLPRSDVVDTDSGVHAIWRLPLKADEAPGAAAGTSSGAGRGDGEGEGAGAADGAPCPVVNPATEEVVGHIARGTERDVDAAVAAGFEYHHATAGYLQLTRWLPDTPSPLPRYAFTTVGVGGVVGVGAAGSVGGAVVTGGGLPTGATSASDDASLGVNGRLGTT